MVLKYLVVTESGPTNYSAFVPDLPGCVTAGTTEADTLQLMERAIELHLEGMVEDGEDIPAPVTQKVALDAGESMRFIEVQLTAKVAS
jgi:predicted RNase H-like HicB family nuclease